MRPREARDLQRVEQGLLVLFHRTASEEVTDRLVSLCPLVYNDNFQHPLIFVLDTLFGLRAMGGGWGEGGVGPWPGSRGLGF